MKMIRKSALLFAVAGTLSLGFTACSSNDDPGISEEDYTNKQFGNEAMAACTDLTTALTEANQAIVSSQLSAEQKKELQNILNANVDNVIYPTYKELGDDVEALHAALGTLSEKEISQKNVDDACAAFLKAREQWERSEAFLMGPASDFSIDPHIDSWPLNRTALHAYFGNPTAEIKDESILGFHALEFILFRNGKPRKVAEFQGNDTYPNFTDIKGSDELKYAEAVIKDLLNHVYELEVAWNPTNATRLAAVKAANLKYQTEKGLSYGENMRSAGNAAKSTFASIDVAVTQVLSETEGSCLGIANEVGTAKISNPFQAGDISYVESPYSYNSITDFQNNIRSIENIWYGGRNGKNSNAAYSFHKFFQSNKTAVGRKVEATIETAIQKIGRMPKPFVKYVSKVWNKKFEDDNDFDVKE